MTERLVGGVDFSGAKSAPNDMWVAFARVGDMGVEIFELLQMGSHALAREVAARAGIAALGIDCPFGLPADFISFLATKRVRPQYQSWQEIAQDIAFMSIEEFMEMVKDFKKEALRFTDTAVPALPQSPLRRINPSNGQIKEPAMAQVTYHGIRLLAMLDPQHFFVLPFQDPIPFGCAVIEVFPRAVLKALALPEVGWKAEDKKDQDQVRISRAKIMEKLVDLQENKGITYKRFPKLTVSKRWINTAIEADHALDALIACYATATYQSDPSLFADPFDANNLDVLLEGWIYNPKQPQPSTSSRK